MANILKSLMATGSHSSLVTGGWPLRLLGAILLVALGLSASVGLVAAKFSEPQLKVSMYVAEDSQAEYFTSDEYGAIVPDRLQSLPTRVGLNNLSFTLPFGQPWSSTVQRFDPCECSTPILVEAVYLSAPFFHQSLLTEGLHPVGASLVKEGSSYLLSPDEGNFDPQLLMYLDLRHLDGESWSATFWGVSLATLGATSVGLGTAALAFRFIRSYSYRHRSLGSASTLGGRQGPTPLLALAGALGMAAGFVQQVLGAMTTGATVDEPQHVRHLTTFFETGSYSSSAYGPVTSLIGHSVNVFLGVETWGVPLETAQAYEYRHLVVALIGVVGTLAVSTTAWILLGSWQWGLVAGALMGALPLWVGHSMFNLKDIPAASGYALVTLGLVALFSRKMPLPWRILFAGLVLFTGLVIGLGTRPGIAPFFALSGAVAVLAGARSHLVDRSHLKFPFALRAVAVGIAGAITTALLVTPAGGSLVDGIRRSSNFGWAGTNLYAGEFFDGRPGAGVIMTVFLAHTPLAFSVLVVVGLVAVLVFSLSPRHGHGLAPKRRTMLLLVTVQAGGAFFALLVVDPVIYDGGRQLLFVLPALAILATVGVAGLTVFLSRSLGSSRLSGSLVSVAVSLLLIVSNTDQIRLFPYNYSYVNTVAQGAGATGQWETDYWASSVREAARSIRAGDPSMCGSADLNRNIGPDIVPCGILAPYITDTAGPAFSALDPNQFWVVRPERSLRTFGPVSSKNCRLHSEVTRPLRFETIVMSRTYLCDDL